MGESRFRNLSGIWRRIEQIVLIMLILLGTLFVLDLHFYLGWTIYREQYLGCFLALVLFSTFLIVPPSRGASRTKVPYYDIVFATLGLFAGLYIVIAYPRIVHEMGITTTLRLFVAIVALVLILEAVRRLTGWVLVILPVVLIFYGLYTDLFPGVLFGKATRWDRLVNYCYLDSSALLGLPLTIASTIALAFIFFGNILFATGGGKFLTDFALAAFGRFRGGPAKVAVVASALFGTISGVATANVYVTGVITIPMMIRTGYKPHTAAAIEAVASTGGIIMPPVMGIVAFLMAEFLGIQYYEIAIAALIPALIYYSVLFAQVDLEAAKANLRGLSRSNLPSTKDAIKRSWIFFVPLAVLVYTLFFLQFQPAKSAVASLLTVLIISSFHRQTRIGFHQLLKAMETTGRSVLDITMLTAVAGIVIGVIFLSGLGFRLSVALVQMSAGNPVMVLPTAAAVSTILGMGMPPAVVYILLAVLMAPGIVELGVPPLTAHMFLLYFSTLSMITPPVCLSSFVAANLAGASPMRTGLTSVRLGIAAYILPFIFVLSPALLWNGSLKEIALALATALTGALFLAVAFTGFLFRKIAWPVRTVVALAAIALMLTSANDISLLINGAGAAILVIFLLSEWRKSATRQSR